MSTSAPGRWNEGPTFPRLLASEWLKLTTLRSTWWLAGVTLALFVGFAGLFVVGSGPWGDASINPANRDVLDSAPPATPLFIRTAVDHEWIAWTAPALAVAEVLVAVGGVLSTAGEFSTGMIRSTFVAAPQRTNALLAKVFALLLASTALGTAAIGIGLLVSWYVLSMAGWPLDPVDPYLWRALAGVIACLGFAGLFGALIGAIIRRPAGSIATTLGVLFVLPAAASIVARWPQPDWLHGAQQFLPDALGRTISGYATAEALGARGVLDMTYDRGSLALDPIIGFDDAGEIVIGPALAAVTLLTMLFTLGVTAGILTKRRDVG